MKKCLLFILFVNTLFCTTGCGGERVHTMTYSVFPYLPDAGYYQEIIENRWAEIHPDIQPIEPDKVQGTEDIFSFALEGLTVNDSLYGIPVFLCGNFLIYDQDCEALAGAEHITDFTDMSEILVVNSDNPANPGVC